MSFDLRTALNDRGKGKKVKVVRAVEKKEENVYIFMFTIPPVFVE